jgi:hypothetical protein
MGNIYLLGDATSNSGGMILACKLSPTITVVGRRHFKKQENDSVPCVDFGCGKFFGFIHSISWVSGKKPDTPISQEKRNLSGFC